MKIGLEVHVALPTKSKLFCACSTDATEPNSSICPICMGFPGSKPMLNRAALDYASNVSRTLGCMPAQMVSFVRKVYFYPDLPKSYQITQLQEPVGVDGSVEISSKKVKIRRIQLEEDPAKIIRESGYTLMDFNRSGIPLLEIVTEPDIASEEELREFLGELRSILYYVGINIEKELKVDLNISLSKARVEVKNVTGIRNLVDAANYEIKRQTELTSKGKEVVQETRSYNEAEVRTESSREKESDEEYGFIFEPDLTSYKLPSSNAKVVLASKVAREYSRKYGAKEKTILELIQFDRESYALMDHAKDKAEMQKIIAVIELLKKYESTGIGNEKFEELLEIAKSGAQINAELIKKVKSGQRVETSSVNLQSIDKEITTMIKNHKELLKEYEKNPKAFNFIVGEVAAKLKANPRDVAIRLRAVLEKGFKD